MPKNDSLNPDPEKVAERYNSELRKVLDKHAPELCRAITLGPKPYINCSLASFDQVSSDIIRKIIEKSLPKSCPSDPVPTRLLKTCLVELLPAITTLLNSSLQTGVFPTAFKEGRIYLQKSRK